MDRIFDRWLKRAAFLVAVGWICVFSAQAQPRVTVQSARKLSINEDPDDPNASREERIRRSRELITKQIAARQKQQVAPKPPPPAQGPSPKSTPAAPKVDMSKAGQKHVSMFMKPAAQSVQVGDRFATQWQMLNPNALPVTSIVMAMSYPADVMKPVSVHQDTLKPLIKGEPQFEVNEAAGQMVYRAELKEPYSSSELNLITIEWQALTPAQQAQIDVNADGVASTAYSGNRSLTQAMVGLPDTVIGADVQIRAPFKTVPSGMRIVSPSLHDLQPLLAGFPDQSKLKPPTVWINQPTEGELVAGQWVVVDIGIDNPDHMVFDEMKLALKFDPNAVEVADSDENNWIHRGVNILDGPFKKNWTWTFQYRNEVDNLHGTILYHVGTETMSEQPSGTVARIFARVKQPTRAPLFSWIWNPGKRLTTGVFLMGDNVYLRGTEPSAVALAQSPARDTVTARAARLPGVGAEKADPSEYRFGNNKD
ncbi:hypothetical protein LLG95_12330 [bacterium]|nr:hypothetical protein [bacterium]